MNAKKELKDLKEDIEKSNNDHNDIISRIKSRKLKLAKVLAKQK